MNLSLTILGGAAAWPNPGQGCSSYLVSSDVAQIVLDCGPDTLHVLRAQMNYADVDAVVISHLHSDHMLDLIPWRYGLKYGATRATHPLPLWLPPGGIAWLRRLGSALATPGDDDDFWDTAFDLHEFDPLGVLTIGDLTITFAPTQHFIPCHAIRVDHASGRSLTYSADLGVIEPLVAFAHGSTTLLVEATEVAHPPAVAKELRGHITAEEAGQLGTLAQVESVVLTHLWCERPTTDVLDAARSTFTGALSIATAGLRVNV